MKYLIEQNEINDILDTLRSYYNINASLLFPQIFNELSNISVIANDEVTNYIEDKENIYPSTLTITNDYIWPTAFQNNTYLITVSFEGTSIGARAFEGCSNLRTIRCNNTTIISTGAFSDCTNLEHGYFSSVEIVGGYAFQNCYVLKDIDISNANQIGQYAFAHCSKLSSINLNNQLTTIPGSCFLACQSLTGTINLPNVTTIGTQAFQGCSKLNKIQCAIVSRIYGSCFANCYNLSSVVLPKLSSLYGSSIFYNCSSLVTLSFSNVSVIYGSNIFQGCTKLTKLYLGSTSVVSLRGTANATFGNKSPFSISGSGSIYVKSSLLTTYKNAANWSAISNKLVGF